MQKNDQMHPDDMKNLILFGIISIVLWLSYDHFILKPKLEQARIAQAAEEKFAMERQLSGDVSYMDDRPRSEVVAEGQRIKIDTDSVFGSINLIGGRIDDLGLKNYYKTIEKNDHVNVLSPRGVAHTRYIEYGWVAEDKNIAMPTAKTQWQVSSQNILSSNQPVTLFWNNGQGLRFENEITLDEHYGFTVRQRVINNTGNQVKLYPYSLISQRGIPEGYTGRFISHEGLIGYFNEELVEKNYKKISKAKRLDKVANKGWIGITEKDWLTALIPPQGSETQYRLNYTKGIGQKGKDKYQVDMMGPAMTVASNQSVKYQSYLFAGAKKLELLDQYEEKWQMPHFDLAVDFGLFYFLTRPFFWFINTFYGWVGNFGVAIIMFTVVLRICVFPLANTSFKSFAKLRQVGPQMAELREQYSDDKETLQKELVKLYQKEKVNPMAGCLPILVQIPIFFALFKVLSNTIEMRHAPFFGWIQDLSAPDPTSIFNGFGLIPWDPPGFLMIGIWPCLMLLTMQVQRKLSPPPTDPFQAQLMMMLPYVMTFVLAKFAAGLVIYWTFNNLFSTIQQYIIMRRMGVEVDLIGNILNRNKPSPVEVQESKEEKSAETEKEPELQEEKPQVISKPKPKKKKATQKKK